MHTLAKDPDGTGREDGRGTGQEDVGYCQERERVGVDEELGGEPSHDENALVEEVGWWDGSVGARRIDE